MWLHEDLAGGIVHGKEQLTFRDITRYCPFMAVSHKGPMFGGGVSSSGEDSLALRHDLLSEENNRWMDPAKEHSTAGNSTV
mmetsp:Transcript_9172/g.23230  ORF Transcript_9172/g.23230 Transcript_9172/m.23230 type:complete len:81 (+) Transcript_9172:1101-1343(+)